MKLAPITVTQVAAIGAVCVLGYLAYKSYKAVTSIDVGAVADVVVAGAANAVFAGTSVISGTATIVICRTGRNTSLGGLATSLAEKPPATAFDVGIRRFGLLILRFTVLLVLFLIARLIVAGMFLNATLRRGRLAAQE